MKHSTSLSAALHLEARTVGQLLAAVAAVGYLSNKILAIVASIMFSIGFILNGYGILKSENKLDTLIHDLREYRKLKFGAIVLTWATNGLQMDFPFFIMLVFAAATFAIEAAIIQTKD